MKIFALLFCCVASLSLAQAPPVEDYQISGIIVDHLTGKPLNHILVQVMRVNQGGGDASVITTPDGRFAFLHLPKGKYNLSAEKRGGLLQGFHSDDDNYSTAIVVDGRQKTDGIVFPLRSESSIAGVILGDEGEPVRNAQVQLLRENVNEGEAVTAMLNNGSTNSSGLFHFSHLEPGRYYIAVSAAPWFAQAQDFQSSGTDSVYPLTFYGDTTDGTTAKAIMLTEGSKSSVQINLRTVPGIRIKLPNPAARVALSALGPGGSRIPVPTVTLQTSQPRLMPLNAAVQNSAEQPMELANLAAGRYEVRWFNEPGPESESPQLVDLTNGSTLNPAHAAASVVTGRITFNGPRPNGGLMLFLGNEHGNLSSEIAADGTFKFPKVPVGTYQVHHNGNGFLITSLTAQNARLVGDELNIPGNASIELAVKADPMANLATLEGFATRDGSGFAGAMVLLLPQDLSRSRLIRRDQSDADGSFTLPNVLPGRYTLVAIEDGHDLAFRNQAIIGPYLPNGVPVTIPSPSNAQLKIPVQKRKP